jgi:lipoprotein NlpD
MKTILKTFVPLLLFALVAGCASRRPAPVADARPGTSQSRPATPAAPAMPGPSAAAEAPKPNLGDKVHVIQKGDTLISVSLANGLDYRELAMWNNIDNPNVIKLGESLRLTPPGTVTAAVPATPAAQPKPGEPVAMPLVLPPATPVVATIGNTDKLKTEPKSTKLPYSDAAYARLAAEASPAGAAAPALTPDNANPPPAAPATPTTPALTGNEDVDWAWPIQPVPRGKIVANFTDANKGVDISGTKGTPVLASAGGKVVYSGAGLRGYGRLVIVKHNATWLSAYAHNEKVLVNEGQMVKKGEKIAEMGNSDSDAVKLHFEIRKQGKPVDPIQHLPK